MDKERAVEQDADARRLARVMHAAFFALLGASLVRFLLRHPWAELGPWVVGLSAALAVLYVLPSPRRLAWLGTVVAVWVVLVVLAPSFAWCAVPLFYTGLRTLPPRAALALVVLLTAFVVAAQLRLSDGALDPNVLVAPPAVAAIATAVFLHTRRQADRLAATERREGTLAERQRLSMEIHDTLAQGLSSLRMLLQAADRTWDVDPATARRHVRTAAAIAERDLAEARRFVHDLAPADLAGGADLEDALAALAARESARAPARAPARESAGGPAGDATDAATRESAGDSARESTAAATRDSAGDSARDATRESARDAAGFPVAFRVDGTPIAALPDRVRSALLRIAQGALANVREHAGATSAALTLTYLDDQVVLDIADDGRGFDPAAVRKGLRGHGLPAIRARAEQLGGTLTIESAPGEGTVLSVSIPLEPPR
ncbi:sensor histidine kinase [Streptomyces sp. NPDC045431]|uniref:sensor histidine kinase n=1 Tax=Streptomyces sp. NPDC045431 TaxID=3155613 RepID=UPI0033C2843F